MDLRDVAKTLLNTPIPVLIFIVGVFLLLVGLGLEFTIGINVANIDKTRAIILGIFFFLLGTGIYLISLIPKEWSPPSSLFYFRIGPFFLYYLISVLLIVPVYWMILNFNEGTEQIKAANLTFILCAILITIVVIWRAVDIYFYLTNPNVNKKIPYGLYSKPTSYLAYFLLLGSAIVIIIGIIFKSGSNPTNSNIIFRSFIIFLGYIGLCRLMWECLDSITKKRIPNPHNTNLKK